MASKCKSCKNTISNCDFITCAGVCGEQFHIKCVSVTKSMLTTVTNSPNIHWYCHHCNDGNRNVSAVVNGINESIERLSSSLSSNLIQFLDGFRILMGKLFETTGTVNIAQNLSNAADVHGQDIEHRKNGFEQRHTKRDQLDDVDVKGNETDFRTTGKCLNSSNFGAPDASSIHNHTKSVVISNIGKSISTDYLKNYLVDELKIDRNKVRVSLLLPAGRTVNDMVFLQFKVTVPDDMYATIMDSNTWPSNVRIRDFVDKPRRSVGVTLESFVEKTGSKSINC